MCFSKEVSLIALIVGVIGSILVYTLGTIFDKIIGLYIGYVSLMQGIEFMLWNHQTCDAFHKNISFLGMVLNMTQPIVFGLILLVNTKLKYKFSIIAIMIMYAIFAIHYCNKYSIGLRCTTPRANDPHLVWNWTILESYHTAWAVYIITMMFLSILGMPTIFLGIVVAFLMLFAMLLSIIIYPRQDMGAMWCFFTVFIPFIYYFLRKAFKIKSTVFAQTRK